MTLKSLGTQGKFFGGDRPTTDLGVGGSHKS